MAPTVIVKRKDLPRHLVRQWYSIPLDKATTRESMLDRGRTGKTLPHHRKIKFSHEIC